MATVVLMGTLDTKGAEYAYVRDAIARQGCKVLVVDVGVASDAAVDADIGADRVANASGTSIEELRRNNDRGAAMDAMARGAAAIALDLYRNGHLQAVMAMGGSGGSSIATAAMRGLPIGVPKVMVSTVAAGDVSSYVGTSDILMLYPVIDFAGLNSISERILGNAAAAAAAMAQVYEKTGTVGSARPIVAITMFGVTTPAAMAARACLENAGYEVLVFHANGAGGKAMETLMRSGVIRGVLDLTTTELADELVGGDLSAGPDRLEVAGALGLPQVVSLGALDMVNFGPMERVPERFRGRHFHRHNPHVTLMRTTADECKELGAIIARKLNGSKGPCAVFAPTKGVSSISEPGGDFFDSNADQALIVGLKRCLDPRIQLEIREVGINDAGFARSMAETLAGFMRDGDRR